jgi:hypothetical protein
VVDYRRKVQEALERGAEAEQLSFSRTSGRLPASAITVNDIVEAVAAVLKDHRQEVIRHVSRLITLLEIKSSDPVKRTRDRNLHQRLVAVESGLRQLQKKGPPR